LMRERYGPMLTLGATTLWESFEPTASLCHGFSASPTYQMSRRILGVSPSVPGFEKVLVVPDISNLEGGQGIVPTAKGDVEVTLHRTKVGFHAAIRVPNGVDTTIEAPPRHSLAKSPINSAGRIEAEFVRETI